jgi:hypothetical protein
MEQISCCLITMNKYFDFVLCCFVLVFIVLYHKVAHRL